MKNREAAARFLNCLGEIDGRYITEAEAYRAPRGRLWKRVALAASLCLVAGVTLTVAVLSPWNDGGSGPFEGISDAGQTHGTVETKPLPTYDGAYLSAAEVGEIFSSVQDKVEGATNAYTTIYAPNGEALAVPAMPTDEYVPVYRYTPETQRLSQGDLEAFVAEIYPRLEAALGVTIPAPTYETDREDGEILASYEYNSIRYNIRATQTSGESRWYGDRNACHTLSVHADTYDTLDIDGKPIRIDQRDGDEAILASLAPIRDRLFEVFGQSFDAAKVVRRYDGYSTYGATAVTVTYYNAATFGEGDRIVMYFDNMQNWDGDKVSATVLENCDITYYRHRVSVSETLVAEANCRLLSLAEAEALLDAGYVFSGHACPLCMAEQTPVSFDDYDYVGLLYMMGEVGDNGTALRVPFYAFYKDIGEAKNGNRIYARTLVPAVEVSGLEAYFEMQKEGHRAGWVDTVPA